MPEEKKCATCNNFFWSQLTKSCRKGHFFIKNDFQAEGLNCPDWVSRTEKTWTGSI
jgi:hypothetical protein